MIKLLLLSGSPIENSSTEILLHEISDSIIRLAENTKIEKKLFRLNDFNYKTCQACGKSPEPNYCIYEDDFTPLYDEIINADFFLFGSPVYFDSVSAQAKQCIDRCNCIRPPDYNNELTDHKFKKRLSRKRPGGIVLVGGEECWFEGARRTIAGFFKWIEVINCGHVFYSSPDFNKKGTVRNNLETLREAEVLALKMFKKWESINVS